jgi:hypothetical protein
LHANGMDFIYGVGHKIFVNKENWFVLED